MSVLGYCILLDSGKEKVKRVVISSVLIKSFASSFFFLFYSYNMDFLRDSVLFLLAISPFLSLLFCLFPSWIFLWFIVILQALTYKIKHPQKIKSNN